MSSHISLSIVDVSQCLHYYLINNKHHDHTASDYTNVITQLKSSIESCGFLYINGCDAHLGYDSMPNNIDELFQQIDEYFCLPLSEKEKSISKDKARRGYSPSESDNFASLLVQQNNNTGISNDTYANDTVEKFRIGPSQIPDGISKNIHFYPNNFEHLSVPLQESLAMYYRSMEILRYEIIIIIYIFNKKPYITY